MRDGRSIVTIGLALSIPFVAWVFAPGGVLGEAVPRAIHAVQSTAASPSPHEAGRLDDSPDVASPGTEPSRSESTRRRATGSSDPVRPTGAVLVRVFDQDGDPLLAAPFGVRLVAVPRDDSPHPGLVGAGLDYEAASDLVDGVARFDEVPLHHDCTVSAAPEVRGAKSGRPEASSSVLGPKRTGEQVEVRIDVEVIHPWLCLDVVRSDGVLPDRNVQLLVRGPGEMAFNASIRPDGFGRTTAILPESFLGQPLTVEVFESREPDAPMAVVGPLTLTEPGSSRPIPCVLRWTNVLVEGVFDRSAWIDDPDHMAPRGPWMMVQRRIGDGYWESFGRLEWGEGGYFRMHWDPRPGVSYRLAPGQASDVLEEQCVEFEPYARGIVVQVRRPDRRGR